MPSVFAKRLRHILTNQVNDTELEKFFSFLDSKVKGVSSEQDANAQREFEDNLLTVFNEKFDFSDLRRLDLSLRVLDHSKSILNTSSVALMLFEPLLKPAIREPLLPSSAVETAKQYIIEGLRDDEDSQDMVTGFQRRVVDLFLLGVWNESGKDIFSLALLDRGDRGRNSWWKTNLQDILLQFGQSHPKVIILIFWWYQPLLTSILEILGYLTGDFHDPGAQTANNNPSGLSSRPIYIHRHCRHSIYSSVYGRYLQVPRNRQFVYCLRCGADTPAKNITCYCH